MLGYNYAGRRRVKCGLKMETKLCIKGMKLLNARAGHDMELEVNDCFVGGITRGCYVYRNERK